VLRARSPLVQTRARRLEWRGRKVITVWMAGMTQVQRSGMTEE
jgi:hypothetical protein